MKKNFPFTQLCTLAFLTMMSITSFANGGCTTHQTFGPERTFVDDGVAGQIFTPCQTGDLKYISVYMQSADDLTFGTHLNVYEVTGDKLEQIHSQQVVVPSISQNPYSKVWLEHDLNVDEGKTYAFEVEVPNDREIIFYHTDENRYSEGDFQVNGTQIEGDLAFEFGIDSDKKSLFSIRERAESRSAVTPWLLNVEDDYSCISMQRYFDGEFAFEGELTQTITACSDGALTLLYLNGVITTQVNTPSPVTLSVIDAQGNVVGESSTQPSVNMEHMTFEFEETDLRGGEQYTLHLVAVEGIHITFNTVSNQQYFTGQLMVNGLHEMQNLCFIGLVTEEDVVVLDDGTHDHGEVDHDIYDEWDPWAHDFHVKPPSEVEELKHSVYPNPFVSEFRVELQTKAELPGTVTLYNFMGKKVFEQNLENISEYDFIQINPETVLNKGYYTLRIEYGDNVILDTVVKN
jgi:hypothetical protein